PHQQFEGRLIPARDVALQKFLVPQPGRGGVADLAQDSDKVSLGHDSLREQGVPKYIDRRGGLTYPILCRACGVCPAAGHCFALKSLWKEALWLNFTRYAERMKLSPAKGSSSSWAGS